METNNIGLVFNKTYYSELDKYYSNKSVFLKDLKDKNTQIFESTFYADSDYKTVPDSIAPHKFCMSTIYPGLLVGAGYSHGTGLSGVDNDINVGFSFDYVTGLPYIPASSVKGLLRSAFSHPELIKELLGDKQDVDVATLEQLIFEDDENEQGKDTFFDAVIRFSDRADKRILGSDYITPHNDETKNPVPVLIIKLLPGVVIEFCFKLINTVISKKNKAESAEDKTISTEGEVIISVEEKQALFKGILSVLGIGAKTNVGYGVLVPYTKDIPNRDVPPKPLMPTVPPISNNGYNQNRNRKGNYGGNNRQGGWQ